MDSHSKAHLKGFSHEHTKLFFVGIFAICSIEAENSDFTSMSIREDVQRHCEFCVNV